MKCGFAAACIAALSIALAGPAMADRSADREFQRGRQLLHAGQIAEACAAFAESQRLDPQFGTEFNLGQCYEKLGRLAAALDAYQDVARRDPNTQRREAAAAMSAKLEPRITHLRIQVDQATPGLAVTIDGRGRSVLVDPSKPVPIDPGDYTVTARASSGAEAHLSVSVRGDEGTIAVPLALEAPRDVDEMRWVTFGPTLGASAPERYGLRGEVELKIIRGWRLGPALALSQGQMPTSTSRKSTNLKLVALAERMLTIKSWQVRPVIGAGFLLSYWRYSGETDRVPSFTAELSVLVGRKLGRSAAWAVGPVASFVTHQTVFGQSRGGFELSAFAAFQLGM